MPIKPKYIKQLGGVLLDRYTESFDTDFDINKQTVASLTNVESKTVRNRVAGYITRKLADQVESA